MNLVLLLFVKEKATFIDKSCIPEIFVGDHQTIEIDHFSEERMELYPISGSIISHL